MKQNYWQPYSSGFFEVSVYKQATAMTVDEATRRLDISCGRCRALHVKCAQCPVEGAHKARVALLQGRLQEVVE